MKSIVKIILGLTFFCLLGSCSKEDDSEGGNGGGNITSSKRLLFDDNVDVYLGSNSKNIQTNEGIYTVKNDLDTKNIEICFLDLNGNQLRKITLTGQTDLHDINKDEQGNLLLCGTIYSTPDVVSGRVFSVKINKELDILWQKKYDTYSLPYYDGYYYNAISNISNSRLVVCNLGNLLIIDSVNGNLLKTLQITNFHWLRTIALSDGFLAFGRVGVNFYIAKFDWNGNLISFKYAQDNRPDALLTCSNPIKTQSNKIIIPYNTYQYNPEGRGGYLVLDLQGNLLNHWNNEFHIITSTQSLVNRGGLPIQEVGSNLFMVRSNFLSYYVNVDGELLDSNFYQGSVFQVSENERLVFNGSQSAAYEQYKGPIIFNKNKSCFTINDARMLNVMNNVNLLSYSFTNVTTFNPNAITINFETLSIPINSVTTKSITFENSDFCNLRAIE